MTGKLSLEKELEVMAHFGIDANSWFLVRYIFIAKFEEDFNPLITYLTQCSKTGTPKEMLELLKEKKILSKKYKIPQKGETLDLKKLEFEDSFLNKYFKVSLEGGQDLFDLYPSFLTMDNGKLLPAKNITTKVVFQSLEAFFLAYGKSIRFNRELHDKIMCSLQYAIDNKIIQYSIVEYVISRKWEDHIKLMEDSTIAPLSNRYDNTELL